MLEHMTHKDYNQTQKVFEKYCTDIGDYHDLYVPTDTSLLADLFEKFRDKSLFKKTKVKLELLTDYQMLLIISGILEKECVNQCIGMLMQIANTGSIIIKTLCHHI